MSDYSAECIGLNTWISRMHSQRSYDRMNELIQNLSDQLDKIFGEWAQDRQIETTYNILALLLPGAGSNLHSVINNEEIAEYLHPFPIDYLPVYAAKLFKARAYSELPAIYRNKQYEHRNEFLFMPTKDFFYFKFMWHSTRIGRPTEWMQAQEMFSTIYLNPFLILYSKYLADYQSFELLTQLTEEFVMKDLIRGETLRVPPRHVCEMLVLCLHYLQQDRHLFTINYNIKVISPDAPILNLSDSFYLFFSKCCEKRTDIEYSYCGYIAEVWLSFLMPWKKNKIITEFVAYDFLNSVNVPCKINAYNGNEPWWESYIDHCILFYTDLFERMISLLCSHLLMKVGDIDLLVRISNLFTTDKDLWMINGHLCVQTLYEMSRNGTIHSLYMHQIEKFELDRRVLCPFMSNSVKALVENLVLKALGTRCNEAHKVKENWGFIIGDISERPIPQAKVKPRGKSIIGPWERPLRSDELQALWWVSKLAASCVDKARRKPPQYYPYTDLRFFASYTNVGFLFFLIFIFVWLIQI